MHSKYYFSWLLERTPLTFINNYIPNLYKSLSEISIQEFMYSQYMVVTAYSEELTVLEEAKI